VYILAGDPRLSYAYNINGYDRSLQAVFWRYLQKNIGCFMISNYERRMPMPRSIREVLGERVVILRRRKGLSQPELASQAGMSVTTLNRVENAHQSLYMEKVAALAQALGTTTDYLLGLSEDASTESDLLPAAVA
jgi:DNA-binding XRE family transcriptional regulator